jgi:hypothetical protein
MSSDLDLIYGTKPKPTPPPPVQDPPDEIPARPAAPKKASKQDSKRASTLAGKLEKRATPIGQERLIESIRKTVKSLGNKVSFTRLTPEEKGRLADIVYTYKRQGIKTSENEINRIAINFLIEDFHTHGEDSVLAQVIEALNA